jgi:hypothetical protein
MTTELLLATGTETWDDVRASLAEGIGNLLSEDVSTVLVSMPTTGQRIEAHRLSNGQLRLAAAGNDSLVGGNRLTVRDERAVIAVGFSVASSSWGTFYWDWTAPVSAEHVAAGVVRTFRDIYKAEPDELELAATF